MTRSAGHNRIRGWFRGRRALNSTALALAIVGGGLILLAIAPAFMDLSSGNDSEILAVDVADDTDKDGLSDATENQVGSDPEKASTLGGHVPDGWVHERLGGTVDWSDPQVLDSRVLSPRPSIVPDTLRDDPALEGIALVDLYEFEKNRAEDQGYQGAWWLALEGLDPFNGDNDDDGIADSWLLFHGLHPFNVDADAASPGDEEFTLRQKYLAGLDPNTQDSDHDGLDDHDELTGSTFFAGERLEFTPTDPRSFSSLNGNVADGFLVRFGLDPHANDVERTTPAGDGLTVLEAYQASIQLCGDPTNGTCDLGHLLDTGPLVDPSDWDSNDDSVPDAWAWHDSNGIAHPLKAADEQVIASSETWDETPWPNDPETRFGLLIDDQNPPPASHEITVADAYRYLRPSTWSEPSNGPWWGGLPTQIDQPPDGALPMAVALRGWNITIDASLGEEDPNEAVPENLRTRHVTADPRLADTDADGRTDLEEYFGIEPSGESIGRTDPSDPDTDGDGLDDGQEGPSSSLQTDPLRRDTSGSYLTDGQESEYWQSRYTQALDDFATDPGSALKTYAWLLEGNGDPLSALERLLPDGSLQGEATNILSADADQDGLKDGEELEPNKFLAQRSGHERPSTDPARVDTDGDSLPDGWEVHWSRDRYFGCSGGCTTSVDVTGWPIDPSKPLSVPLEGVENDASVNLAGDQAITYEGGQAQVRPFSNRIAYQYDLDPYSPDTNEDGIPDMFALHWGVENIPDTVQDAIASDPSNAWAQALADRISTGLTQRGFSALSGPVILDPSGEDGLNPQDNPLSRFTDREKGVWVLAPEGAACDEEIIPSEGARRESSLNGIVDRAGLDACWTWVGHPLALDVDLGTDPWRHDSDEDGLPDAWEAHYDVSAPPASFSQGSLEAGCKDPALTAALDLPPGRSACLTHADSFRLGIDPNRADNDGGGLVDWLEIQLGLDPLDELDDYGQEDWDGDGIRNQVEDDLGTNRLLADTDKDGLLDGDLEGREAYPFLARGQGEGDLCLKKRGSNIVPGTEHRPEVFGGPLTVTELYHSIISAGVLVEHETQGACTDPGTALFKREGVKDTEQGLILGAGRGTDSLRLDTSGDGLPDGWLVYWRDLADDSLSRSLLDPRQPAASEDPDEDFAPTGNEYRNGRPQDWEETRDGPWWGGTAPIERDTDGDTAWFLDSFEADDQSDPDTDNDGLDVGDPFPGIDQANQGLFEWTGTRYQFEYQTLWEALASRSTTHLEDRDDDQVPDFLDRARVTLEQVTLSEQSVAKGQGFQVSGRLTLNEPQDEDTFYFDHTAGQAAAHHGSGVEGATIEVRLVDQQGHAALVGIGFSGPNGWFDIDSAVAETIPSMQAPPSGAIAETTLLTAGQTLTVPSTAPSLEPGQASVELTVVANDPGLQPLQFWPSPTDSTSKATAYKSVPFPLPRLGGKQTVDLQAVVLKPDGSGPSTDEEPNVRHAAEGVFATIESQDASLILLSPTRILTDAAPDRVLSGSLIQVNGSLVDAEGAGLPGRSIEAQLQRNGDRLAKTTVETGQAGTFQATFNTHNIEAGSLDIQLKAILQASDSFLNEPEPTTFPIALAQDPVWAETFTLDSTTTFSGDEVLFNPSSPTEIKGRLLDHNGDALDGHTVHLQVLTFEGQALHEADITLDEDGNLHHVLPALSSAPVQTLELRLTPDALTSEDVIEVAVFFLQPRFPVEITATGQDARISETAFISGRLMMEDGRAIVNDDAALLASGPNGTQITHRGTDATGAFQIPLNATSPEQGIWAVRFLGSDQFLPSQPTNVLVRFTSDTTLEVETPPTLRGAPVGVTGRLLLENGAPATGEVVEAGWATEPPLQARTNESGAFSFQLPARNTHGPHEAYVLYTGTPLMTGVEHHLNATVLLPTRLNLSFEDQTVPAQGPSAPIGTGQLTDDRGDALPGRQVQVVVSGPQEHIIEAVTGTDGRFVVDNLDLVPDPAWRVSATPLQVPYQQNTSSNTTFSWTYKPHLELLSAPSLVRAGDPITFSARIDTATDHALVANVTARTTSGELGRLSVLTGELWTFAGKPSWLPNGSHPLHINVTGPGLEPTVTTIDIQTLNPVDAQIDETILASGGRLVTIELVDNTTGDPQQNTTVWLLRSDEDGRPLSRETVRTDDQGKAAIELSAQEQGKLQVIAIGDPTLEIASQTQSVTVTGKPPLDEGTNWTWIAVGIVAITLAASAALTYRKWAASKRKDLRDTFAEAEHRILDGSGPPETVIRQVHAHLLRALTEAGYHVRAQETARDIARGAHKLFRLPLEPLERMTRLFELVEFSNHPVSGRQRSMALQDLRRLAAQMEGGEQP